MHIQDVRPCSFFSLFNIPCPGFEKQEMSCQTLFNYLNMLFKVTKSPRWNQDDNYQHNVNLVYLIALQSKNGCFECPQRASKQVFMVNFILELDYISLLARVTTTYFKPTLSPTHGQISSSKLSAGYINCFRVIQCKVILDESF